MATKKAAPKKKVEYKQRHYFSLQTSDANLSRAEIAVVVNAFQSAVDRIGGYGFVEYGGTFTRPKEKWEK